MSFVLNKGTLEYDIALLELDVSLPTLKPGIAKAFLPLDDNKERWPPMNELCTFVGWGCRGKGQGPSEKAQVISLKVIPNQICSLMYRYEAGLNVNNEFCAGFYQSNAGICPVSVSFYK